MIDLFLERTPTGLDANDAFGKEELNKFPLGATLRCRITQPRNVKFHRLFFGMLNLFYEQQDQYATLEDFLEVVKKAVGHSHEIVDFDGQVQVITNSISFDKMDEISFRQFFDRVEKFLLEKILPLVKKPDFEQHLYEMLGGPTPTDLQR